MLTHVIADILEIILYHVEAEDVFSLMTCGNRQFTRLLTRCCRHLSMEASNEKRFPYWAFKLNNLIDFVIYGTNCYRHVELLLKGPDLELKEGLHALQVIHFEFSSSLDIIRDGGATLQGLFPHLHTLALIGSKELVSEAFLTHLPRTLQRLCLLPIGSFITTSNINISAIARLPESLTHLELSCVTVSSRYHHLENGPYFPPNLKVLAIGALGDPEPLNHLPLQLESLDIKLEYDEMDENQPWIFDAAKSLPPTLTSFYFSGYIQELRLDNGPPYRHFDMNLENLRPSVMATLKETGWAPPLMEDDEE